MSRVLTATLADGRTVKYTADVIGEGSMKSVHMTTDRKEVVCFFKDAASKTDPERRRRLQSIVDKYNPTRDPDTGAYWQNLFCWPTGVVVSPELGVVAPTYPSNFFFASGPFAKKEKQGTWFTSPKLRKMIPESERGTWLNYLQISIRLARAIRRMHAAGLAHSDLSNRNVLIDPSSGAAVVIDIDSLVVPQIFPPDVIGTRGYIAPEVLATVDKELTDPARHLPSRTTDQYALAVLIYEYLLERHPLRGPKVNSTVSAEDDDHLSMGTKALWIEDAADRTNRPSGTFTSYAAAGPYIAPLFERAFGDGLHAAHKRPGADEWERALVRTTDLLVPCAGPACTHKWFVYDGGTRPVCPWCKHNFRGTMPVLNFYKESRPGQFVSDRHRMTVYDGLSLYGWHVFTNEFAGERSNRTPLGYFAFHSGQWILVNQRADSMHIVGGGPVPVGQGVPLTDGLQLQLSRTGHGRLALIQMITA